MSTYYKYKAIDASGKIRHNCIHADNIADLENRLNNMGLDLINAKLKLQQPFSFAHKGINRRDLINFTFQIQQLTKAGVSILDGLSDLKNDMPTMRMREVIYGVIDEIQSGKTFSQALAIYPHVFNRVYTSLIKVGEETGRLAQVLQDIADTLKWQDELASHTRKIMIYPAFVIIVISLLICYLMIFLVPQLIPFIKDLGGVIPIHTRALLQTSWFLENYWPYFLTTPVIIYVLLKYVASKNPSFRLYIDCLKLKVIIFGPIILKIKLARFSNYFAMMYASGLSVLDSLKISELIMGNTALTQSIIDIRKHISDGGNIADSFAITELYPPLVIRMLKVGEKTGALDESLLNISYFYNREVKESIDKMEATITPVLTIIMGSIMIWIMSAVLGPIYDSLSLLQY